jgi:hypothetical protein
MSANHLIGLQAVLDAPVNGEIQPSVAVRNVRNRDEALQILQEGSIALYAGKPPTSANWKVLKRPLPTVANFRRPSPDIESCLVNIPKAVAVGNPLLSLDRKVIVTNSKVDHREPIAAGPKARRKSGSAGTFI